MSCSITRAPFVLAALAACASTPDSGPSADSDAKVFYGDTVNQNAFANQELSPSEFCTGTVEPVEETPRVLLLFVDTANDSVDPQGIFVYALQKALEWGPDLSDFWVENSFENLAGIQLEPVTTIHTLEGDFDDYFHGPYTRPSLTTKGLPQSLTFNDPAETPFVGVAVRSDTDPTTGALEQVNVQLLGVPYSDPQTLVDAWQATFDGIRSDWIECKLVGQEIQMSVAQEFGADGAFLHTRNNGQLQNRIGLDGPFERHGDKARLLGKPVGSSISTSSGTIRLEIRSMDLIRRYDVPVPGGTYSPLELSKLLAPSLNSEFGWIETPDQVANDNRIRLWMVEDFGSGDATVRVVGGDPGLLVKLGLDGPARVDGVTSFDERETVRDAFETIESALSLYMTARVAEAGPVVSEANEEAVQDFILEELEDFTAIAVIFAEGNGVESRRAAAFTSWPFDVRILGGTFEPMQSVAAGGMIGTGHESWETWAHEFGHVMGFDDLYANSLHDSSYAAPDYVNDWGIMARHMSGSHAVLGHKGMAGWVTDFFDVPLPPVGVDEFEKSVFTLAPLEVDLSKYEGVAGGPFYHGACLGLDDAHAILVEYRASAGKYSKKLPGGGGVLVTDVVDPNSNTDERPPITVLNPHGFSNAKGLVPEDLHDLGGEDVFPGYPGNLVRVIGTVPGKPGMPDGVRVEVARGPSLYVDPKITPWNAKTSYQTPDIWIDWPEGGQSWSQTDSPPSGNGDPAHWHPDAKVLNKVMVRVHNGGTVLAESVGVEAFVVDHGIGDAEWTPLLENPPAPRDIPPGGSVDFAFNWRPTTKGASHSCVKARITGHASIAPESTTSNNEAQENITSFHPTKGSPYAPTPVRFMLRNKYDRRTRFAMQPSGLRPGFDLELADATISLGPEESREVTGWLYVDEAIPPNVKSGLFLNLHAERFAGDSWVPYGGFSANVFPTTASELSLNPDEFVVRPDGEQRFAVIRGSLEGLKKASQPVDVALVDAKGDSLGGTAITKADGSFEVVIEGAAPGPAEVMAYYFGPFMAPDSVGPLDFTVD